MSDGGGSAAAGTGGPGTFSQPTSPTMGLQRYNLDDKVKNLDPQTAGATDFRARLKRLAALRRDQARRASARQTHGSHAVLKKDHPMLADTIEAMVGTLSKSVSDIHAAGGDKVEELIKRSFTEFKDAVLTAANDDLAKRGPIEEPLHKGLGLISRISGLLAQTSSKVEATLAGYDDKWCMPNGNTGSNQPTPTDIPTEDVAELLQAAVHMTELALRAAVNQHVDLAADEDLAPGATLPPGMHLIMVPDPDGGDGAVVKTMLPEGLAKFATDPAVIAEALVERGVELMLFGGVDEDTLDKLFVDDGEPLNKQFPPKKKTSTSDASGGDTQTDAGANGAASETTDPDADPNGGADAGASGDPTGALTSQMDDPNGDDPMAVALRIWAALGIQLDHIHQQLTGGASDMTGQTPDDTSDNSQPGSPPAFGKSAGSMGLAKAYRPGEAAPPIIDHDTLEKLFEDKFGAALKKRDEVIEELSKGVALLLNQPAPAKGLTGPAPLLFKQADVVSNEGARQPTAEELEAELMKLSPEERAFQLIKISQTMPEPSARNRR